MLGSTRFSLPTKMSYKQAKEDFVAGGTGTSLSTVNAISAVGIVRRNRPSPCLHYCTSSPFLSFPPSLILQLSYALYSSLLPHLKSGTTLPIVVDYALTVVPLLLAITVLADRPWTHLAVLLAMTLLLFFSQKSANVNGEERDEGKRRRDLRDDDTSDEEERDDDEEIAAVMEEREGRERSSSVSGQKRTRLRKFFVSTKRDHCCIVLVVRSSIC